MMIIWPDMMGGDYEPRVPPTPNYIHTATPRSIFEFNQLTAADPASGRKLVIAVNLFIAFVVDPQSMSVLINGEPATLLYQPTASAGFGASFWLIDNAADPVVDVDITTSVAVSDIVVDLWPYFGLGVAPLASAAGGVIVDGATTTINLTAPAGSTVFATENNKVPNTYSKVFALHKAYASTTALVLSSPGGGSSSLAAILTLDRTTTNVFATGNDIYCQRLAAIALSTT